MRLATTHNGKKRNSLKGDLVKLPIELPCDRAGSLKPKLISKHQSSGTCFDDNIISLYAKGMTVREAQQRLP